MNWWLLYLVAPRAMRESLVYIRRIGSNILIKAVRSYKIMVVRLQNYRFSYGMLRVKMVVAENFIYCFFVVIFRSSMKNTVEISEPNYCFIPRANEGRLAIHIFEINCCFTYYRIESILRISETSIYRKHFSHQFKFKVLWIKKKKNIFKRCAKFEDKRPKGKKKIKRK